MSTEVLNRNFPPFNFNMPAHNTTAGQHPPPLRDQRHQSTSSQRHQSTSSQPNQSTSSQPNQLEYREEVEGEEEPNDPEAPVMPPLEEVDNPHVGEGESEAKLPNLDELKVNSPIRPPRDESKSVAPRKRRNPFTEVLDAPPAEVIECKLSSAVSLDALDAAISNLEDLWGVPFDRKSVAGRAQARGSKGRQILAAELKVAALKQEKADLDALAKADEYADKLFAEADISSKATRGLLRADLSSNKRLCQRLKRADDDKRVQNGEVTLPPASAHDYRLKKTTNGWQLIPPKPK